MSIEVIKIKEGDTLPILEAILRTESGIVNLTGVVNVYLSYKKIDSENIIKREAQIIDAVSGKVQYEWLEADTLTEGRYLAEFEVHFPAGKKLTFPNQGYFSFEVVKDL